MGIFVIPLTVILTLIFSLLYIISLNIKQCNKELSSLNFKNIGFQLLIAAVWIIILSNIFWPNIILEKNTTFQLVLFVLSVLIGIFLIKNIYKETDADKNVEILINKIYKNNNTIQKMNEQKIEFVSLASHRLRGPLANIIGFSSMILEGEYGETSPKIKSATEKIYESSKLMNNLVSELLNVDQIEKGKVKYEIKRFDINNLLNQVSTLFIKKAHEKNLKIKIDLDLKNKIFVNADIQKIKQVIFEIMENAIKYTLKGEIKIELKEKNDSVEISIKDTGIGITKGMKNKLFKKFMRSDDAFKIDVHGSGLGLYMADSVMKSMGGKIWAESEGKNKGSIFYVSLPVYREN